MSKKNILLLFLGAGLLLSCAHDPIVHHDPEIEFLDSIPAGALYQNGDTVHLDISMSDEDELHEGYIYIRSAVDTFFTYEPYVHELQTFHVDTFWVVTGMVTGVSASVTAVAHNHHEGITTKNIPINLVP